MSKNKRDPDKELGAIADFVRAVDESITDWVLGDKVRVDGILKARAALVEICCGYVPKLRGADYAEHAEATERD